MMLYEKADVIQECIKLLGNYDNKYEPMHSEGIMTAIKTLEQFKTEVDALAEQEAESHANDVCEDCEIKNGTRLTKEAERGNLLPVIENMNDYEIEQRRETHDEIMIPVGVPEAYGERSEEEFYKREEIQKS